MKIYGLITLFMQGNLERQKNRKLKMPAAISLLK